ncbi:hypothetical protein ACJA88_008282 [Fusarium oxysporum]
MTTTTTSDGHLDPQALSATQRSRWATQRKSVNSSNNKRNSLLERMGHKKTGSNEKNPPSDGSDPHGDDGQPPQANPEDLNGGEEDEDHENRTLFFNQPLPEELLDENGHPTQVFTRNKIRTAKYTPLSFVPKNLWFQFHNVANIFFLFLVILVIFPIFGGVNPGLNAVPLIFIIAVTAIKDAIEDYRRTILDIELNNAPVHRLRNWNNVNVMEGDVSMWRQFKKANSKFFGSIWRATQSLWSKKAKEERAKRKAGPAEDDAPRPSVETHRTRQSMRQSIASPFTGRESFMSAREDIQMTPVPSPSPQATPAQFEMPDQQDAKRAAALSQMKSDIINYNHPPSGARFQKDTWKSLVVGDFVRIYNDEELPADVIILSTSDPDGGCYVETKNLDGETNLKVRQALRCGRGLKHARDCERAEFVIESEGPQPNLYKYNGAIKWKQNVPGYLDDEPEDMTEPITIDNLLLRGCNLRNTEWIVGVVIYTGHDTKIMMNAGITPSKRARIAREMNFNVVCNFGILLIMCLLAAIINGVAWAKTDASLHFFDFGSIGGKPAMSGFITFWAAIILFQNLVPISLYITLEIVRTLQAIFIYSDVEMYYEPIDQPCIPKSWNISDDVGQIEYIFSDKTGTLTQNVMEFKKATINGQPYGEAYTEAQAGMQKRLGIDVEKEAERARAEIADAKVRALAGLRKIHDNPYLHDEALTFIAPDFVSDLAGESGPEQQAANEYFMLALALCHTVMAEKVDGDKPKMIFKAQSPDEEALVATARDMGFTVLGSSGEGINLNVDEDETGEITDESFFDMAERLLDDNLQTFGITGSDHDLALAKKNHEPPAPTHGLVIDGFTLRWVLNDRLKQKFLLLCKQCKSVLCCRVSPAQKAAVVAMVKNGLDVMTLSIGDGANDVAMIQEADVGVGIAGVEGRQAAMSSDYAIAQFRFLQRLVLVHGRWSYRRLAESISNFFYKNMVWTFSIFWYEIYCDMDMTYLFDYTYILMFNLFFTSVPVAIMGVLDQDVSDKVSLAVPQLYRRGIERLEWTQLKFWLYMIDGVYQSIMVFFIPYLLFMPGTFLTGNGLGVEDRLRFGAYVAHPAVITINMYILINTYRWDWLMVLIVVISDVFIFFWTGVYTSFTSSAFFYGTAAQVYGEATFWACFFLVPVICLFPRFAIKALQKVYWPYDVDIIREQERMGKFAHLYQAEETSDPLTADTKSDKSKSSKSSRRSKKMPKHVAYGSVDEDLRPIYPPSTATRTTTYNQHSQNGSDSTNYTAHRISLDVPMQARPSIDRARPSYDRMRASMDRVRPSFEASNDFTSAARLSRIESSQSQGGRFRPRLRGLSLTKSANI